MASPTPLETLHDRIEAEEKFSGEQKTEFKNLVSEYYYQISYGCDSVRLNSINIRNFNNIARAEFSPLGESTVLHAQNSEGKTSLLKSIQFNLLGLPEEPSTRGHYGMTNLIREDGDSLNTEAKWQIDNQEVPLQRQLITEGRGGKLKRHNEPTLGADEGNLPQDRHNQSSEVFERFGLLPLINRGYEPYEVMSLFCLMSNDFLDFLKGPKHAEILDMIFGIYLTNVSNAVKQKKNSEVEITDSMARAPMRVEKVENDLAKKQDQLEDLQDESAQLRNKITSKRESLESIRASNDVEEVLMDLRSRKSSLRSKIADLKLELSETTSKLAETERKLERYDDTELLDDIGNVSSELNNLMTVPDRCPACTHRIEGARKKKMLSEGTCPLCEKNVPEERLEIEREHQPQESAVEKQVEAEEVEKREELQQEKRELEASVSQLEQDIQSTETELQEVDQKIEQGNLADILEEKEELEDEISVLQQEAVSVEINIDRVKEEIEELRCRKLGNEHLQALLEKRKERERSLSHLQSVIQDVRIDERRRLKSKLSEEMEHILNNFTTGIFSNAEAVRFDRGDTYQFSVITPERRFRSGHAGSEAAEATLLALVFHSGVLKRLSELEGALPIRFLMIDSPFANEMASENRNDVSRLLAELPDYLEDYQVIIAMADLDFGQREVLEDSPLYLTKFEGRLEETETSEVEEAQFVEDDIEDRDTGVV